MNCGEHLTRRHTVGQVRAHDTGSVLPIVDLQRPRHVRRAAVQLLIEIVTQPADRLREDDPRRDRIAERGQRNTAQAARDPRADTAERHRAPDAQAAVPDPQRTEEPGTAFAEVLGPVRDDVIQPSADETERHRPQRDVVDDTAFTTPGHPASVTDHQRRDDTDDDAQRIRTDRDRTEVPHALRRAWKRGEDCRGHAVILCRTPSASSAVSARTAPTPSCNADTNADPTITPSA